MKNNTMIPYNPKKDLETNYYKKTEVELLVAGGSGGSIDLSNYYKKLETYSKAQVDALIAAGGADLSDYYTKSQVDSLISAIPETDLTNYYNKTQVDSLIPNISTKQDVLVSATNIKTINGESILGSGDIVITGGGSGGDVDLTVISKLNEKGMNPDEIADGIEKIKNVQSSASEIDRVSKEIPKTALNALAQAQNRRVDLVMIGDSNQLKDGFGFAGAFAEKLGEKYGLYATGIGAPANFSNEKQTEITGAVKTGVPAEIESLWASNSPESYEYLNTTGNPNNGGCIITGTSNINTTKPLRAWFCYGGFSTGSGNFNPSVRVGVSPFTSIAEYGNISTNTTTASKNINFIDIPEDLTRTKTLEFKWCQNILAKYTITAPFVSFFSRFERPNLEKGVSVHTLYGVGGQSLYDVASTLVGYSDLALKNFFEETRRLQLAKYQKPIIVVYINSGLNDLNETEASLGDLNVPVGNSKEAYFDNLNKVIDRIEKVYSDNWDINELHFLIIPSHPTGNQTEVKLDEYRLKCKETYFNRTRCSYINLRDLVTSDYMLSQGYYLASGGDRFHLNKAGYLDLVGKVVDTITEF